MKKIILISVHFLLCLVADAARISERTFLTTDRRVYVAGERVWCSAFCFNASDRRLSELSSVAYYELHSMDGMALNGRIALQGGRGAAVFELPSDLPTGNYKIISYTAQSLNEQGVDHSSSGTLITVINASSTARVKNGVIVSDTPVKAPADLMEEGGLVLSLGAVSRSSSMSVSVTNPTASQASLSVSVYHDDGMAGVDSPSLASNIRGMRPGTGFTDDFLPEYDGEIVRARIVGLDPSQLEALSYRYAFISAPGDMADVYASRISKDGHVAFYTNNIYGSKDLVCEIEGLSEDAVGHLEIVSPFVDFDPGEIPSLTISPSQSDAIMARKASMTVSRAFDADTLYDCLPVRLNRLFGDGAVSYRLDDYTRFPLMSEVFTEFIPELRARKDDDGKTDIQVRLKDTFEQLHYSHGSSLIMLDGTPVFDHSKIMAYDPLLVESINVYPYVYLIGSRYFSGVVDIITYKKNLPSMTFNDNVRVYDFNGASFPMALTCRGIATDENFPDFRQTLLWHPQLEVAGGRTESLECVLPPNPGHYRVVVEGTTQDGTPLRAVREFDVR